MCVMSKLSAIMVFIQLVHNFRCSKYCRHHRRRIVRTQQRSRTQGTTHTISYTSHIVPPTMPQIPYTISSLSSILCRGRQCLKSWLRCDWRMYGVLSIPWAHCAFQRNINLNMILLNAIPQLSELHNLVRHSTTMLHGLTYSYLDMFESNATLVWRSLGPSHTSLSSPCRNNEGCRRYDGSI